MLYRNINNEDNGRSVREKLNTMLGSLIDGTKGVNAIWEKILSILASLTETKDTIDRNCDSLQKGILQAYDYIDRKTDAIEVSLLRNKGYYPTIEELKEYIPYSDDGCIAYVGSNYPYKIYRWESAEWVDTGEVLTEGEVNLAYYYTRPQIDAKVGTLQEQITLNTDTNTTQTKQITSLLERVRQLDCIVDLGTFDKSSQAETRAIDYASQQGVIILTYATTDGRRGWIEQVFSNSKATVQYLYFDGSRFVRKVSWGTGVADKWQNITGSERIQGLVYDSANRTIGFKDSLGDANWGKVTLPFLTGSEEIITTMQQAIKELTVRIEELEKGGSVEDGTLSASARVVNEVMSVQGSVEDGILKL